MSPIDVIARLALAALSRAGENYFNVILIVLSIACVIAVPVMAYNIGYCILFPGEHGEEWYTRFGAGDPPDVWPELKPFPDCRGRRWVCPHGKYDPELDRQNLERVRRESTARWSDK